MTGREANFSDAAKATTLEYTTNDDGVHVVCDWCGNRTNMGFSASVYDAFLAVNLHGLECSGGKD